MKKSMPIFVAVYIGLSGCAPMHYTRGDSDFVTLYLRLPGTINVQFASSTDHYQIHDTQKNAMGLWEISVPHQPEFRYFYLVDGSAYLPDCRFKERDDFGKQNCIYLP
jgi:hypothetical protein